MRSFKKQHGAVAASGPGAMRVLHVRTVRGNGGGPEKTIFRSAELFAQFGVAAEALYLLDAATPSYALLRRAGRAGIPVHFVAERSAMDPSGAVRWRS